ncbi:MAG: glycosyl transferase [Candidatus Omnitrophica bacterium]|nr:glycosyl transferase [Candidatus Omnitrophota bacterium]
MKNDFTANKADTGVFTLCSCNFLACAKILGDSLSKFNPQLRLIIGLVDKIRSDIDLSEFSSFEIIEIDKAEIPDLDEKSIEYDIVELNTAVKPSFFKYLFKTRAHLKNILFFDPDIMFYDDLTLICQALEKFDIVLTPHIIKPLKKSEIEQRFFKPGLYNLGFVGLKRSKSAFELLDWWEERLRKYCKFSDDLCFDQKWMDFSPIFFDNVGILKHPGLNVACWNAQERAITKKDNKFFVNNEYPLIFFHFSGVIVVLAKDELCWQEDKLPLIQEYQRLLDINKHAYWQQCKCYYIDFFKSIKEKNLRSRSNLSFVEKILLQLYRIFQSMLPEAVKKKIRKIRSDNG